MWYTPAASIFSCKSTQTCHISNSQYVRVVTPNKTEQGSACVYDCKTYKPLFSPDIDHGKTTCKKTHELGIDILIAIVYSANSTYQIAHSRITVFIHVMIL